MTAALRLLPAVAVLSLLPVHAQAQDPQEKLRVVITGCVKGSTLTESNLRIEGEAKDDLPARKWRLRANKALMKQIKQHESRELEVAGETKSPESATMGGRRIGRTNIYIGGDPMRTQRDPLPELPTIDVDTFKLTGEACR